MRNRYLAVPALVLLLWLCAAPAQTEAWLDWVTRLQNLETEVHGLHQSNSATLAYFARRTQALAAEVAAWLRAHPETDVAPPEQSALAEDRDSLLASIPLTPVDTPRHKTYGALTWRPFGRLQLLADLRYEAGRYGNNPAGRLFLAPVFADAGVGGTLDLGRGVQLQAGMGNVFDRNYFLIEGYPEPGRNGYVNLRYRF